MNESLNHVSDDELTDKINSVFVGKKNHEKLQYVNTNKLL